MEMEAKGSNSNGNCSNDHVLDMCRYGETGKCRRKFQLNHLGEEFDPTNCNKTCDNCKANKDNVSVDVSSNVAPIRKAAGVGNLTYKMLVEILRGKGKKNHSPGFGLLGSKTVWEVEQSIKQMLIEHMLNEKPICFSIKGFNQVKISLVVNGSREKIYTNNLAINKIVLKSKYDGIQDNKQN